MEVGRKEAASLRSACKQRRPLNREDGKAAAQWRKRATERIYRNRARDRARATDLGTPVSARARSIAYLGDSPPCDTLPHHAEALAAVSERVQPSACRRVRGLQHQRRRRSRLQGNLRGVVMGAVRGLQVLT